MPSPSATLDRAHVCTNAQHSPTNAEIAYVVSQCGEFATIGQIITGLGLNAITMSSAVEAKIRAWLDDAGWLRVKITSNSVRVWGYEKPGRKGNQAAWEKEELLAAIVHQPRLGQLLMPMLIHRPYAAASTVELVDLNALQRDLALSLLSSDNSLNIASTSAALDELSTTLASALALCKRSKAAMNSATAPGDTSMDCSSFSRTSNSSGESLDSFPSIDFSSIGAKDSHRKAADGRVQAGGNP